MADFALVSGDLHAHYPMDSGLGMKIHDQTRNQIHGTLHSGVKWVEVSADE
jgi:hypothetical protein